MKNQPGFTLIELLIVIAIIGFMLTLVGSFSQEQLRRQNALDERRSVGMLVAEIQRTAYLRSQSIELQLRDNQIIRVESNNQRTLFELEYHVFEPTILRFNRNGISQSESLAMTSLSSGTRFTLAVRAY